jgi:hypothetical protein
VTVGRYESMLGFEAKKPTGLFQSSTAYSIPTVNEFNLDFNTIYGGMDGVKYTIASDTTFFGISVNQADDTLFVSNVDIVEVAASLDLGGGFSVFVGGSFAEMDQLSFDHYNAYVTYETGAWLFAAELNATQLDDNGDGDIHTGLLMANYEYSDIASVTARFSTIDFQGVEFTKHTLAHNYAFSDSLLLVTEVSQVDSINSTRLTEYAVELLFRF